MGYLARRIFREVARLMAAALVLSTLSMRIRRMTPTAILLSVTSLSIRMAPAKSIAQQKSGAAAPLLKQNAEMLYAPMPTFPQPFREQPDYYQPDG
jgi:hypothetical protein